MLLLINPNLWENYDIKNKVMHKKLHLRAYKMQTVQHSESRTFPVGIWIGRVSRQSPDLQDFQFDTLKLIFVGVCQGLVEVCKGLFSNPVLLTLKHFMLA